MKTFTYTLLGLMLSTPIFASAYIFDVGSGYGMMGYGHGGGHEFFMAVCMIVWTVVGILAGVWLWQHIEKK